MRNALPRLALIASTALLLTACGGTSTTPTDPSDQGSGADGSVEVLGGEEAAKQLDELYASAQGAGQTDVTVYGPGESDKEAMYEVFSERFPGITVNPVYILGPDLTAKLEAEFASGQHVGDLIQNGDAGIAGNLIADQLEPFEPVLARQLDPVAYSEPSGTAWAATAATFGFAYNTNLLSEDEAPKRWEDLLDPSMEGQMVSDDVTRNGAGLGTLSHLLWDGRYEPGWLDDYSTQGVTFQASTPAAGSAVATGEFAVQPAYPMAFYLRDRDNGAPMAWNLPEEGVHLSPHYVAQLKNAPNAEAAKLLMAWLFTPEAQQAAAELGYYPLLPGESGPEGLPAANELDLLKPISLTEVLSVHSDNLEEVNTAFEE
ncbi:extracellular solute-binding protein [Microbacterium halotolerans]|uniref:extracellular solute-binding protein n=1 Tax=Microbacterium halotolerans TaxID=246613 RepID=UPI000E6AD60F|nr:extracellular solute-binding protein [Microbacterium halotolerans]